MLGWSYIYAEKRHWDFRVIVQTAEGDGGVFSVIWPLTAGIRSGKGDSQPLSQMTQRLIQTPMELLRYLQGCSLYVRGGRARVTST